MLHALSAILTWLGFWLLLSGYFQPFLISMGVASVIAVYLLVRRLQIFDREGHPLDVAVPAILTYWPWLVKEIFKSGWDVSRRLLDPRLPISPTLVRFCPTQVTPVGLVIHANSITLTPGTISVEVSNQEFLVHALTREGAAALECSEMDKRISALERRP